MNKPINVLVSNLGLPYYGIGSWTYEINYFLKKNDSIDFVLSPTSEKNERFIYCKKRPWPKLIRFGRIFSLRHFVAVDYLKALFDLTKLNRPLSITIIDDQALLEAICIIKSHLTIGSRIIFYYHGHKLTWSAQFQQGIDKVLFLTQKGYLDTLRANERFLPEVSIVGNGVDSSVFFRLSPAEKTKQRREFGLNENDIIITWMANSRPVKGLHLFLEMIPHLLKIDLTIKVVVIGSSVSINKKDRVFQTGKLDAEKVSKYLQISDFYFFTSLWEEGFGLSLVEAIKCGNFILASNNGGIPEVLKSYPRSKLIDLPNVIESWVSCFQESLSIFQAEKLSEAPFDYNAFYDLKEWENRLSKALE